MRATAAIVAFALVAAIVAPVLLGPGGRDRSSDRTSALLSLFADRAFFVSRTPGDSSERGAGELAPRERTSLAFRFAEESSTCLWEPVGNLEEFRAGDTGLSFRFEGIRSGIAVAGPIDAASFDVIVCDVEFRGAGPVKLCAVWEREDDGDTRLGALTQVGRYQKSTQHASADGTPSRLRIYVGDHPDWSGTVSRLYLLPKIQVRAGELRFRSIELMRIGISERLTPDASGATRAKIDTESRPVLYAPPPSRWTEHVRVPAKARLETGFAVLEPAWNRIARPVEFAIEVRDADRNVVDEFRTTIDPRRRPSDRRWFDARIDLARHAGRDVAITFETRVPDEGTPADAEAERLYAVWSAPAVVSGRGGAGPPNVILVSLDTLRADRLSEYGHAFPTSPVLDALARRGVLFETCISQAPETLPAHRTMLTGTYPMRHRSTSFFGTRASTSLPSVAQILKERGYATAAFTEGGGVSSHYGFDRGFDRYDNGPQRESDRDAVRDRSGFSFVERTFRRAEEWVRENADRPFFLFLHTYEIHMPYGPPPPFDRIFDPDYPGPLRSMFFRESLIEFDARGECPSTDDLGWILSLYDGGVRYTDRCLGRFLEAIDEAGLTSNTLLVVT